MSTLAAPPSRTPAAAPGVGRAAISAVMVLVALTLLAAWQLYNQLLEQRAEDAQRAARIVEEHAEKLIGGHLAALEPIEWLVRDEGWGAVAGSQRLHARLRAVAEGRPEVQSVWLFDAAGDVRATSIGFPPPTVNFGDRDYFLAALRGEDRFIGQVAFGRITQEYHFNLMRRIDDADGELLGVLVVSLYPEAFRRYYESIAPGEGAAMLLHESGALLARHPMPTGDPAGLAASNIFMAEIRGAGVEPFRSQSQFEAGEFLYAARRVSGLPLYVAFGVPIRLIVGEWLDRVLGYGLVVVPALGGVAGLGWLAYRQATAADRSRFALHEANVELERRVAERTAELAESEEVLRAAVDGAELGTWEIDVATGHSRWSEAMREILGLPPGQTEDERVDRVRRFHPEDRDRIAEAFRAHVEEGAPYQIEFRFIRPSGEVRWLASSGNTLTDAAGRPDRVVGIVQDITERKRAEEHQRLLMAELDHRVRNTLAVVQALAQQSLIGTPHDGAVFTSRLAALARTHTILAENRWAGADLRAVVDGTLSPYRTTDGGTRHVVDGPPVRLSPKVAQSLGLALHELSANAAKYGALSTGEGRVEVSWQRPAAASDRLVLCWREQGGPPVVPPTRRGFGTRFVEQALAYDLGGAAELSYAPEGFTARLELTLAPPLDDLGAGHAAAGPAKPSAGAAAAQAAKRLRGRQILVVEDEMLLAQVVEAALADAGAIVIGPAASLTEAERLLARGRPDAAILDVNLAGTLVWPVADRLRLSGVPVLLVTGYDALVLPEAWRDARRLTKPLQESTLLDAVGELLADAGSTPEGIRSAG